ncbi:MAG TPA: CRTAC1 family protein [Prolixibacteraceae bacterium]|nr:CRTAC1 family protein [Prolixibacteraceae bacterium]
MKQLQNVLGVFLLGMSLVGCNEKPEPFDFVLVKEGNVVEDPGYSQGAAWADYDNDGDEDLFVTNSWTNGNNLFYENNGDGTFTKVTDLVIVNDGGNSNGCSWGDVDNDGDADLFVANVDNQNNFFYQNNGNGTFSKVENGDMVTNGGWSYTCAWADYNNDGWLDLFVGNYNEQNNFLFKNDGSGNLIRVENNVVTVEKKSTQGCAWFDYNDDGLADLYVANKESNNLYKNLGNGQFEKVTGIAPVTDYGNSFGCSAADYNNDGFIDLFVANWWGENHLYKNLGNGQFEKISGSPVTTEALNSEGSSWGDYDNDGDLDLFVTNDGNNSFFENRSNQFVKLEHLIVANDSSNSNGITWNDFNIDGNLDLFIANGGNQPNLLYMNPGNRNNWLEIKLEGTQSNKSSIGAKIYLYQDEKIQLREITSQSGGGYGAQNGYIQHFGLGENKNVDSVVVCWPSGKRGTLIKPKVNRLVTITEN